MTHEQQAQVLAQIFTEGMAAHREGKALDANPYVTAYGIDHNRAFEWELGWCAARDTDLDCAGAQA